MLEVSVAEAKAKLSELLNKIEQGEQVTITRPGKTCCQNDVQQALSAFCVSC